MSLELQIGEKEITVHVAESDRIDDGVAVEFRQVTNHGAASWSQRIHLSKEEAWKLRDDLGDILGIP